MEVTKGTEVVDEDGRELFVAVCDRDLGITLKSMETEEDTHCLNKEQLIARACRRGLTKPAAEDMYNAIFASVYQDIICGKVRNFRTQYSTGTFIYSPAPLIPFWVTFDCAVGG